MDAQQIHERLTAALGDSIGELVIDNPDPYIVVATEAIARACAFLRDEPQLACDFLESICGVDTGEHLWLVYHLFGYKHRHGVILKLRVAYDAVDIPTCCDVWPAANWHEREQYDLFGFNFIGHPDLRRILLPEDWEGHPLLKSYGYPEQYHGIEHYRPDPKMQLEAADRKLAEQKAKAAARPKAPPPAVAES